MTWRSPLVLLAVGFVAVVLIGGGAYLGLNQSRSTPQPGKTMTPASRSRPASNTPTTSPLTPTWAVSAQPLFHHPAAALPTFVPLAQITPAPVDVSTWKVYSNASWGLSVRYPSDWTLSADRANPQTWVAFYPPSSDPKLPSPNISFSYWSDKPYPAGLPQNIIVDGISGNESETPSGQLGYPGSYEIRLPYRTGMLDFSVSEDLDLKSFLKAMLTTLILKP